MARRLNWEKVNRENLAKRRRRAEDRAKRAEAVSGRTRRSQDRPLTKEEEFWLRVVTIDGRRFGRYGTTTKRDDGTLAFDPQVLIEFAPGRDGVLHGVSEFPLPLVGHHGTAEAEAVAEFERLDVSHLGGVWATDLAGRGSEEPSKEEAIEAQKRNDRAWRLINSGGTRSGAHKLFLEALDLTGPGHEQHDRALLGLETLRRGSQRALDFAPDETRKRNGWTRLGE